MKTAQQIKAEIAELEQANDAAPGWGAAVGARLESIKWLRSALRRLPVCPHCGSDDVIVGDISCNCNGCGERFATEPVINNQRPTNKV